MVNFSSTGNSGPQGLLQFNPAVRRSAAMVVIWLVIVNGFALVAFNRLNLAPDTAFRWMARAGITPPAQNWEIVDIQTAGILTGIWISLKKGIICAGKRVLPMWCFSRFIRF
nr:hypothetical protein [Desulfobacula sp.]